MSNRIQASLKGRARHLLAAGIAAVCAMGAAAVLAAPGPTAQGRAQIAEIQQRNSELNALRGSPDLAAAIKARQVLVENLIRSNPGATRSVMLDPATAQSLRASQPALAGAIEAEGQWSGEVVAFVADDFVHRSSSTRWMLHSKDGKYIELSRVGGESLQPLQHQNVTVAGVGTSNVVAAEAVNPAMAWPQATAADNSTLQCSTLGAQNVAVLLMNQPDSPALPAGENTASYWQNQYFGSGQSLTSFWQETSYGQTSATGTVFGPYTFDAHYECGNDNAMVASAEAAATAAGVDLSPFTRISIVFNSNSCSYGGLGTLGCVTADSAVNHPHSITWIPTYKSGASASYARELTHEMGHNLGLNHAGTLDFGSIPLGSLDYTTSTSGTGNPGTAVDVEYGDPYSVMGGSSYLQSYGSHDKSTTLGWIPFADRKEVTAAGTFALVPYENSSGLRALRVLRDPITSSWLWVEYRQPLGTYDSLILGTGDPTNLFDGAVIRLEDRNSEDGHQFLLDFNASASPNDFLQADLTPGHTWVDPYSLLRVQINSASASGLSATVGYDAACATLSLSSNSFTSAASTGSITVTAPASCAWQASTAASWITLTGAVSGTGNGTVPFSITANSAAAQRIGYITVQRQSLRLTQAGTGVFLSPLTPAFGSGSTAQLTAAATDPNGLASLGRLGLDINGGIGTGCPVLAYRSSGNYYLFLFDDSGNGLGGFLPGSSGTATNGRCTLNGATSSSSIAGNTLTVTFGLSFAPSFIGGRPVNVYADDSSSGHAEVRSGTFVVTGPTVTSVTPSSGNQGATVPVTITGNGTHFTNSSVLSFSGSGVSATGISAASATQLGANIVITGAAATGSRILTITTGAEVVTGSFAVTAPSTPGVPTNLTATPGNSQVALSWTASAGATSYQVFKSTSAGTEVGPAAAQVNAPTTSATITGLSSGTTYYFVVRAVNATGTSAFSNEAHAAPTGVPPVPANLTATPGNSQVALSWTASSGATSYQVFKSTSAGAEVGPAAATVNAPTTSATITGLTSGTTYYFVVRALNSVGPSAFSNEAKAVPTGVPLAPTNLAATPGNSQVALSWTASSGATSYQVFKSTSAGAEVGPAAATINAPTTSATITGLTSGTTYYFVVRALNSVGPSAFSNEAHAVPTGVPLAPTGLAATPGNGQVALSWTASSGATSYQVFKSTTAGAEVGPAVAQVNAPTTSATITGLTNGTTYYFVVRAVNAVGPSAFSNEAHAAPAGGPPVPANLTATPGSGQVALSWTASSGATSYQVFKSTTAGAEVGPAAATVTAPATSATVSGLTNGTTYYFVVRALNAVGPSAFSNEAKAVPN